MPGTRDSANTSSKAMGKAIVLDEKPDLVTNRFAVDLNLRRPARGNEFDGIAQQVGEALQQESFIAAHRPQRAFDLNLGERGAEFWPLVDELAQQELRIEHSKIDILAGDAAEG